MSYGTYKDNNHEVIYKGKPYYVDFTCGMNYWYQPATWWEPDDEDWELDTLDITRMVDENGNDVTGELREYVEEELAEDLCENLHLFTWDDEKYEEEEDDWYHRMRDEDGFLDSSLKFIKSSDMFRDITKMKEYFSKGSNPEALARTVKDMNKAVNRYAIAKSIGWNDAAWEFERRAKQLGATEDDFAMAEKKCGIYGVSSDDFKSYGPIAGSKTLPDMIDKWFRKNKLTYNARYAESRDKWTYYHDSINGCCYTIVYEVEVPEKDTTFWFANHTNEGGGTYGYAVSEDDYNLGDEYGAREVIEAISHILGTSVTSSRRPSKRRRLSASANRVYEYILHNYFREDLEDCRNINDVIDFIVEKGFPANEDTYAAARWIWDDINAA